MELVNGGSVCSPVAMRRSLRGLRQRGKTSSMLRLIVTRASYRMMLLVAFFMH